MRRPAFRTPAAAAAMLLGLLALLMPAAAGAGPADINAAARGVVRVVIIADNGDELFPVEHGTGFAVGPQAIVTNAHVVARAVADPSLAIGIVPSDGGAAVYGRLVATSARNDLALIQATGDVRLPPLTLAGENPAEDAQVSAVGYPQSVDRAAGLKIADLFSPQPPVKSRGNLAGRRSAREVDTLLHTAAIAPGNSGGPLLDECGRVVGVNSFGTDSGGAGADFFFAVSVRELAPFLRANGVTPAVNGLPCRSLAELDAAEAARAQAAANRAQAAATQDREAQASRHEAAERRAQMDVMAERENAMALAGGLVILALIAGLAAWQLAVRGRPRAAIAAGALGVVAVIAAIGFWVTRPGYDAVEDRVAAALASGGGDGDGGGDGGGGASGNTAAGAGRFTCVPDVGRSRITTGTAADIPLQWSASGCVNGRTQYGLDGGRWSRVFVPGSEAVVSVNRYDPDAREYRIDRYLLPSAAMAAARAARGAYSTPECGAGADAARDLGAAQAAIVSALPPQPNERIVYSCSPSG